jgi:hypothetical protein
MQSRIDVNRRTTEDTIVEFLERKHAKLDFQQHQQQQQESTISQKKKCDWSQSDDTQDIPCQCTVSKKDSLRQFVLRQVETYPEVDFYQKMLLKYIEADIDQSKREVEQRNLEANVCLFAPHIMPIVCELLPMLGKCAEREFSMQGIASLVSNVMKVHHSSAKAEMPTSTKSSTSMTLTGKTNEKLCSGSCCTVSDVIA